MVHLLQVLFDTVQVGSSCQDQVQLMPVLRPWVPPGDCVTWLCPEEVVGYVVAV